MGDIVRPWEASSRSGDVENGVCVCVRVCACVCACVCVRRVRAHKYAIKTHDVYT